MCSLIALMPSVRIYINGHENEENALSEMCPNFWPVLYILYTMDAISTIVISVSNSYMLCSLVI